MSKLTEMKYRAYPFLFAAIGVIAATGAGWRGN